MLLIFYTDETPTSVDYVRNVEGQFVSSYNSSHCVIYDIETKNPITRLECSKVIIYKMYNIANKYTKLLFYHAMIIFLNSVYCFQSFSFKNIVYYIILFIYCFYIIS